MKRVGTERGVSEPGAGSALARGSPGSCGQASGKDRCQGERQVSDDMNDGRSEFRDVSRRG
jgi:hypothetical protein